MIAGLPVPTPERVPLPKDARTHCRECEDDRIDCTRVEDEGPHNVRCVCQGCGNVWYVSES